MQSKVMNFLYSSVAITEKPIVQPFSRASLSVKVKEASGLSNSKFLILSQSSWCSLVMNVGMYSRKLLNFL
ncbi:hypothetical protein D3C86_1149340 [compost metagenome]